MFFFFSSEYALFNYLYISSHIILFIIMNIDNITISACLFFSSLFKSLAWFVCSSVLRPCFPHVNVCGLSQLHSLPKFLKMAAINTLALKKTKQNKKKRWLTFVQGSVIQQALAAFMALLAGQRSWTGFFFLKRTNFSFLSFFLHS